MSQNRKISLGSSAATIDAAKRKTKTPQRVGISDLMSSADKVGADKIAADKAVTSTMSAAKPVTKSLSVGGSNAAAQKTPKGRFGLPSKSEKSEKVQKADKATKAVKPAKAKRKAKKNADPYEGSKFVWSKGRKSNNYVISEALRSLVNQLDNGLSEKEALQITSTAFKRYSIGWVMGDVLRRMELGQSMGKAFLAQEDIPEDVKGMIKAAPTSRELYDNLKRAADSLIDSAAIREEIKTQLITPVITLAMLGVAMLVFSMWVFPSITDSMAILGEETPKSITIATLLINIMKWIAGVILGIMVLIGLYWFFIGKRFQRTREHMSGLTMRMPYIGPILRENASSRLFQLMAANMDSGMPEADALEAAGQGCGEEALERDMRIFAERMRGVSPPKILEFASSTKYVPYERGAAIIGLGSSSGMLRMLKDSWPQMKAKAERETKRLSATLQPAITWTTYGVTGAMLIVMAIPMYAPISSLLSTGGV